MQWNEEGVCGALIGTQPIDSFKLNQDGGMLVRHAFSQQTNFIRSRSKNLRISGNERLWYMVSKSRVEEGTYHLSLLLSAAGLGRLTTGSISVTADSISSWGMISPTSISFITFTGGGSRFFFLQRRQGYEYTWSAVLPSTNLWMTPRWYLINHSKTRQKQHHSHGLPF